MNRSEDEEFDTWLGKADTDLTASVEADLDAEAVLTRIKRRTAAGPRIFISSAWQDRASADQLLQHLCATGLDVFLDEWPVTPDETVAQALTESDYHVLLWSEASVGVARFEAALVGEVARRGSFLFVVRLDDSPLPPLLTARGSIDQFRVGWLEASAQLAGLWRRDRTIGLPVRPAPRPTPQHAGSALSLYVRSQDLGVAHVISVPARATGGELVELVRAGLALPEVLTALDGAILSRFEYRLTHEGEPIPELDPLHLADGATIDLEVAMKLTGSRGTYTVHVTLAPSSLETESLAAFFSHLTPKP